MAPGSIIGRLQGTLNQPHGIPQLDKDRKIDMEQLKTDVANGIAALNAMGNLIAPGATLLLTRDESDNISIEERISGEFPIYIHRVGEHDYEVKVKISGIFYEVQNEGMKDVANGIAGLDASAKMLQAQMPNLEIHSQTPQILTGAGTIDITSMITYLVTGGAGADALILPDGVEGQEKIILIKTLSVGGDTSVITPTNFAHGTTITGNAAGSIQNLIFSNGAWHWTGGYGVVIA